MKKWIASAVLGCLASVGAGAESFPVKPITIVVPFPAGGPTDRVARDLALALRKPLGDVAVQVENIAGAGSAIGTTRVARAAPDGYTLLLNHIAMATMQTLVRSATFKVETDFEYLGLINEVPMTLVGRNTLPATSFKDLLSWLDLNKGNTSLGHAGLGSASHLCGLLLQSATHIPMTSVAYKGTAPAMIDLVGGQIDLLCDQTTNTSPQIEAKKITAYAVTSNRRLTTPTLKSLPTLQESGVKGFEITIWHGLYAPKGTPPEVVSKLNTAMRVALKSADFGKRQSDVGAVLITDRRLEPAEHKKFVLAEIAKWRPLITAAKEYVD